MKIELAILLSLNEEQEGEFSEAFREAVRALNTRLPGTISSILIRQVGVEKEPPVEATNGKPRRSPPFGTGMKGR